MRAFLGGRGACTVPLRRSGVWGVWTQLPATGIACDPSFQAQQVCDGKRRKVAGESRVPWSAQCCLGSLWPFPRRLLKPPCSGGGGGPLTWRRGAPRCPRGTRPAPHLFLCSSEAGVPAAWGVYPSRISWVCRQDLPQSLPQDGTFSRAQHGTV